MIFGKIFREEIFAWGNKLFFILLGGRGSLNQLNSYKHDFHMLKITRLNSKSKLIWYKSWDFLKVDEIDKSRL